MFAHQMQLFTLTSVQFGLLSLSFSQILTGLFIYRFIDLRLVFWAYPRCLLKSFQHFWLLIHFMQVLAEVLIPADSNRHRPWCLSWMFLFIFWRHRYLILQCWRFDVSRLQAYLQLETIWLLRVPHEHHWAHYQHSSLLFTVNLPQFM